MEIRIDEKKVRHLMLERDIDTYSKVADAAGLSVNTVSKVVKGKNWTNTTLASIACALGCSPLEILVVDNGHHSSDAA